MSRKLKANQNYKCFSFAGLDGRFVSPNMFPVACGAGTWMLTLGFTLAYGAMFSKIWRVHRLTTKNKSDSKTVSANKNNVIKMYREGTLQNTHVSSLLSH